MSPQEAHKKAKMQAALQAVKAIADTIKELRTVPSGHLYAQLMGVMTLTTYESIIETLIRSNLIVRDTDHLLRWIP